jgi:hypothetical protein
VAVCDLASCRDSRGCELALSLRVLYSPSRSSRSLRQCRGCLSSVESRSRGAALGTWIGSEHVHFNKQSKRKRDSYFDCHREPRTGRFVPCPRALVGDVSSNIGSWQHVIQPAVAILATASWLRTPCQGQEGENVLYRSLIRSSGSAAMELAPV